MVQVTRTELAVTRRQVLGKKVKRLRWEGVIPANIFGRQLNSEAIQMPTGDLVGLLRAMSRNEIVYLRMDGEEPRPTLIRHVQRHTLSDQVLHVDFQQISLVERVRLEVPIVLVGDAPAVETYGGTLLHGLDHITVEGLPTEVPSQVEADVSGLETMDAALHVRDLAAVSGVTVLTDPDVVVATVVPPKVEGVPVAEEVLAEGEEAEGAAKAEAGEGDGQEG